VEREWPVRSMEVTASENFGDPGRKHHAYFLSEDLYANLIEAGKQALAALWGLSPRYFDDLTDEEKPQVVGLSLIRSLFPRHLRNLRALLAAIGAGAVDAGEDHVVAADVHVVGGVERAQLPVRLHIVRTE